MSSIRNIIVLVSVVLFSCTNKPTKEIKFYSPSGKIALVVNSTKIVFRNARSVDLKIMNSDKVIQDITIEVNTLNLIKEKVKVDWNEESFICYCIFGQEDGSEKVVKLKTNEMLMNDSCK